MKKNTKEATELYDAIMKEREVNKKLGWKHSWLKPINEGNTETVVVRFWTEEDGQKYFMVI